MPYLEPAPEQITEFVAMQQPAHAVAMLNLLRYRDVAAYVPEAGAAPCSGREAYACYAELALPCIQAVGGQVVFQGQGLLTLVGPQDEHWDDMFIVHYPSQQAFVTMINSLGYQAIAHHRQAALTDSRLVVLKPGTASFQKV